MVSGGHIISKLCVPQCNFEVVSRAHIISKLCAPQYNFEIEIVPRRAGDPARLIADTARIEKVMGWKAKNSLTEIVESAWQAFS